MMTFNKSVRQGVPVVNVWQDGFFVATIRPAPNGRGIVIRSERIQRRPGAVRYTEAAAGSVPALTISLEEPTV